MYKRQLLVDRPLFQKRRCYQLTLRAAKLLGVSDKLGKPIAEETKITAVATLVFCRLSEVIREKLTIKELNQHAPGLVQPRRANHFYLDMTGGRPRLSSIRVDRGSQSEWTSLIQRCARDFSKRYNGNPSYQQLVDDGAASFTVLTPFEEKKEQLDILFADPEKNLPIPVRVHVVEEIFHMLPNLRRSRESA